MINPAKKLMTRLLVNANTTLLARQETGSEQISAHMKTVSLPCCVDKAMNYKQNRLQGGSPMGSVKIVVPSCRKPDNLKGTFAPTDALLWNIYLHIHHSSKMYLEILSILPAIQPCDCWTWWNQREGRYNISPAFTVHCKGFAWAYSGYSSRSGFKGSRGIQGT